jgi:hypothetical protein
MAPDMCPMAHSADVMPTDMHNTARPHPTKPLDVPNVPGTTKSATTSTAGGIEMTVDAGGIEVSKLLKKAAKAAKRAEQAALIAAEANPVENLADLVTKAVDARVAETVAKYEKTIEAMQAEIDDLGGQPDPAQAPLRGVVRTVPEPIEKAEDAQPEEPAANPDELHFLHLMKSSPLPSMREQAEARINQLLTKQS